MKLKSSEKILLGRLCTRHQTSISNFVVNFLYVFLHLLIVLSNFLISKLKNILPIGKMCSLSKNILIVTLNLPYCIKYMGFPGGSVVKNPPANARDMGSIPASGRSPGQRNLVDYSL